MGDISAARELMTLLLYSVEAKNCHVLFTVMSLNKLYDGCLMDANNNQNVREARIDRNTNLILIGFDPKTFSKTRGTTDAPNTNPRLPDSLSALTLAQKTQNSLMKGRNSNTR
jgi:hypothetical protein